MGGRQRSTGTRPQQALGIARELDDPALLTRALTACGAVPTATTTARWPSPYFAEAIGLARAIGETGGG